MYAIEPRQNLYFSSEATMKQKTIKARVYGKVQGVWFRDNTREKARELNLCGWVRNCSDGSVETIVSGNYDSVKTMVDWLHLGSPHSHVRRVVIDELDFDSSFRSFTITY